MPAFHKLLPFAAALLLLLLAAGQGVTVTALVSPDITGYLPWEEDIATPPAIQPDLPAPRPDPPGSREERGGTVGDLTPDLTGDVLEYRDGNGDVVGWLYLPGAGIDVPVLQNPPELADNRYYLNVNFEGQPDRDGTFCTDFRVRTGSGRREELSRNTTVYGHSWTDDPAGAMFAPLKRYRDPDFARENPYIFYSTAAETMAWEVFAVFDATIDLPYITPDPSESRFTNTLDIIYDLSLYSYDSAVGPGDKILTLSTCTYSTVDKPSLPDLNDYRFVVMAKLVEPGDRAREEAVFAINDGPMSPDAIGARMMAWR